MAEVTLEFLGEQLSRPFGEMREFREELRAIRDELHATRDELRAELRLLRDEITVLTGAFMRQDAEQAAREGDRLAAAGLLAKQRRIDERLGVIEARLAALEAREPA
ncbi:MAG TPA: hypothetical protein VFY87_02935 [Geminicoccaceae bacterium]|nr:hypothetical protein [Geminicoccaceae bacterium]